MRQPCLGSGKHHGIEGRTIGTQLFHLILHLGDKFDLGYACANMRESLTQCFFNQINGVANAGYLIWCFFHT
ncbi:hypothetical protein D3C76_1607830 [compost metagenome]